MKIIKANSMEVSSPGNAVVVLKNYKPMHLRRVCNLCDKEFLQTSKFDRFCDECRIESELYHFAEWLSA